MRKIALNELTHIDLFSGIGGFALSARWTGFRTVVFCEKDEWCQRVLVKNFGAEVVSDSDRSRLQKQGTEQQTSGIGQLSEVVADAAGGESRKSPEHEGRKDFGGGSEKIPIIPDIHEFNGSKWRGATLLTGGFPCQPFSCAGKRGGKADDRFLWPEMVRVIAEARPTWIIGENVRGIVTMELDRVLSDLEGIGYACWPVIIPACAVDAKHRRDRVWIVCHADKQYGRTGTGGRDGEKAGNAGQDVADGNLPGPQGRNSKELPECARECVTGESGSFRSWPDEADWFTESGMGRVAHGIPKRVDRLKGLGNAIVPQVAAELMGMIVKIAKKRTQQQGLFCK